MVRANHRERRRTGAEGERENGSEEGRSCSARDGPHEADYIGVEACGMKSTWSNPQMLPQQDAFKIPLYFPTKKSKEERGGGGLFRRRRCERAARASRCGPANKDNECKESPEKFMREV